MKLFYCLAAALCLQLKVQAQDNHIKPLTVGDAAPAMLLKNVYNHFPNTIDIANRNGKPLLIDFWASWCGSCIGMMPKLEAFNKQFAGQLEMVSVNIEPADTEEKINAFLRKRKERTGLEMKMAYVLQDTLLEQYFPSSSIPELVWIDSAGKVAAITGGEELSEEHLHRFVKGEALNDLLPQKIRFDKANPFGQISGKGIIYRNSLATESKNLQGGVSYSMDSTGNRQCYYVINYSLMALLQIAYPEEFKYGRERIIYDGDRAALETKYSYEYSGTDMSDKNIHSQLRAAIKNALRITAYSAQRKIPCAVLTTDKKKSKAVSINTKQEYDIDKLSLNKRLLNEPPRSLLTIISKWYSMPVLEKTKLEKISIQLPFDIYDYTKPQLLAFLKTQGFVITETEIQLPVAVIQTIQ